ncbi:galactokinase [Saccharothrix longispora]|uniref:galactokinase n=1 Tax=Saccharothrix longispora TaxID=33920 RepID=UPI0028FDC410|nr:galactokinase [Saccharothrix longispora]MDU0294429.1 galactokinase [Saccharothrix longispora]
MTPGPTSGPRAPGRPAPAERASAAFERLHGTAPAGVWSAPGRVNLIGEHTDYNDGFVLPFALPHRTAVAAAARDDGVLRVATLGDDGGAQRAEPIAVADLAPGRVDGWAAYPAGVAWVLREQGLTGGADLVIAGDVPAGAGLSSSHALECAVALALLGLAGRPADDLQQVARWVQRAENDFAGAPTGLLDQTASLCCTEAHVLFLDVRSFTTEQVPFDAAAHGLEVLVVDTRSSHSHTDGGYGARRSGCEEAAGLLGLPALRDLPVAELDGALARLPGQLRPLVRHVVTENERVLAAVELLRADRLAELGPLLDASHASLRDDYRVSAPELDAAVDAAVDAGALGARMVGGGFGGSAIALVPVERHDGVVAAVLDAFARKGWTTPRTFTAVPSAGAGRDA